MVTSVARFSPVSIPLASRARPSFVVIHHIHHSSSSFINIPSPIFNPQSSIARAARSRRSNPRSRPVLSSLSPSPRIRALTFALAVEHNGLHPTSLLSACMETLSHSPLSRHRGRAFAARRVARSAPSERARARRDARDRTQRALDFIDKSEHDDEGRKNQASITNVIRVEHATNVDEGWRRLRRAARASGARARREDDRVEAQCEYDAYASGCVRFVIDVPRDANALEWVTRASNGSGVAAAYWSPRARNAKANANASERGKGMRYATEFEANIEKANEEGEFERASRGARAGVGASATWTDADADAGSASAFRRRIASMRRFLNPGDRDDGGDSARAYGAARFDPERTPSEEWASFGTHYFFLPTLEFVEGVTCATLAVCVCWDANGVENCGPSAKSFMQALDDACETLERAMKAGSSASAALPPGAAHVVHRTLVPDESGWSKDVSSVISRIRASRSPSTNDSSGEVHAWADLGSSFDDSDSPDVRTALESLGRAAGVEAPSAVLDQFEALTMAMDNAKPNDDDEKSMDAIVDAMLLGGESLDPLRKVVLARRSNLELNAAVDSFALVSRLQSRDPDAYQFVLRHPNGETFLGSTPERLFLSHKGRAASEAVAGTRARGADDGEDAALAYDMLLSPKEHEEFAIVREEVRNALSEVAQGGVGGVRVEIEKGILRNVAVQHLYSRLSAALAPGKTEADLFRALHPTPAVCGYPRQAALETLRAVESFDRGLYAGPLGWISAEGAEFAVAIRSALVRPDASRVSLYAGVGVVGSANAKAEWNELNLKTKPLETLLAPAMTLASMPNPNAAWASILIGELVRGGVTTFCVAPGSRSTPLALAAEKNVAARVIVCLDERALGFYALGYAKGASRAAAVICSSGTAVANLFPAVVEASESSTPLLLLTADRPYELRDTGANQTIDQVKIFGSYARYTADLAPPGDGAPARACATMAATALRYLRGADPGPVHLNCAFREPLGPQRVAWDSNKALKGLERWESSSTPFTLSEVSTRAPLDGEAWRSALTRMTGAKRGMLVVGGGSCAADAMAAVSIARTLGWAVAADATSGMRVGAGDEELVRVVPMIDYALVEPETHDALRPDVIVQLGSRLTSKRLCQFLEASAIEHGAEWIVIEPTARRLDPAHCVSIRVQASVGDAATALEGALSRSSAYETSDNKMSCIAFAKRAVSLGSAVAREASTALGDITANEGLSEMAVACAVSEGLPHSMGLFLGNSMPIRDVDALSGIKYFTDGGAHALVHSSATSYGVPVTANRGASGIDGVLSSAAGFAAGLGHPVTLIIGDVSFQHDSNGLLFLRERPGQPPVTVVVVNNGGGGIFSFLPVAAQVDDAAFNRLFATPPDVTRRGLCEAHRVAYTHPLSIPELHAALRKAWSEDAHSVIEVTTSRARNLAQHKMVQRRCARAARHALGLSAAHAPGMTIANAEVSKFSIPLAKPVTTTARESATRDGWLLKVTLGDGTFGYGEASPLPGLHRETFEEAGAQIAVVASLLKEVEVPSTIALMNGTFTAWIEKTCGMSSSELLPTTRFALESAVLNAMAANKTMTLAHTLSGEDSASGRVWINALVDAAVDVDAAVIEAKALVAAGHRCLKVKVGRGVGGPGAKADAHRLAAIRAAVGPDVVLRADANRRFTFTEALDFGASVQELEVHLQYVEEPTASSREMSAFFFTTGVPVALDETIDEIVRASSSLAEASAAVARVADRSNGVAAVVMKPAVVGGLEATSTLARIAMSRGVRPIISSAFETGVGLYASMQLAAALDDALEREITAAKASVSMSDDLERRRVPEVTPLILALDAPDAPPGTRAHGLGTQSWLAEEIMTPELAPVRAFDDGSGVGMMLDAGGTGAASKCADAVTALVAASSPWGAASKVAVKTAYGEYNVHCVLSRTDSDFVGDTIVLLHGFMGSIDDWDGVARGLTANTASRVLAIDLPAHGNTTQRGATSIEAMRDVVRCSMDAFGCEPNKTHVVGYSMGARVALALGAEDGLIKSIISIGGSPGVRDARARESRAKRDDELAHALRKSDVRTFAAAWYKQRLFSTLAAHPRFGGVDGLARRRAQTNSADAAALADCLSSASPGRQAHTWDNIHRLKGKSLFIVGERDGKFTAEAKSMCDAVGERSLSIVKGAGHAVHLEKPEALVVHLTRFFESLEK